MGPTEAAGLSETDLLATKVLVQAFDKDTQRKNVIAELRKTFGLKASGTFLKLRLILGLNMADVLLPVSMKSIAEHQVSANMMDVVAGRIWSEIINLCKLATVDLQKLEEYKGEPGVHSAQMAKIFQGMPTSAKVATTAMDEFNTEVSTTASPAVGILFGGSGVDFSGKTALTQEDMLKHLTGSGKVPTLEQLEKWVPDLAKSNPPAYQNLVSILKSYEDKPTPKKAAEAEVTPVDFVSPGLAAAPYPPSKASPFAAAEKTVASSTPQATMSKKSVPLHAATKLGQQVSGTGPASAYWVIGLSPTAKMAMRAKKDSSGKYITTLSFRVEGWTTDEGVSLETADFVKAGKAHYSVHLSCYGFPAMKIVGAMLLGCGVPFTSVASHQLLKELLS